MNNENPLVSIIIPTFNRSRYLEEAISSVAVQTYSNIEIIVVDDGSKVNYAETICNKFENCVYYYKNNGGLSSARNFGISQAKGEFIAFLDDDDFWATDKIAKQIEVFNSNPNIDLIHSKVAIVDEYGNLTGEFSGASADKLHKRSGYVFWNALGTWVVRSPTPLIRKKVFQSDLLFDESINVGEDIDFYQRMFYRHRVFYIDEPLAFYREYNDENRLSLQQEKYMGIERKMYLNFKKMGIRNPVVLNIIARRLLVSAMRIFSKLYPDKDLRISTLNLFIRPAYYLNKYFK